MDKMDEYTDETNHKTHGGKVMNPRISKKDREVIYAKYNGRCAYTGTELKGDWQVDHIQPIIRLIDKGMYHDDRHVIGNMVPAQKIVNHYKGGLDLETFRDWYMGGLHERLRRLPVNPRSEKSIKRKAYLLEIAGLFGITADKRFEGKFYFEKHTEAKS